MVVIMPQGTIPRGRAFFDPVLRGRWGTARLAAQTGAPVIPIGLWGTEKVWPRSAKLPNVLNIVDPPVVTVRVGASGGTRWHRSRCRHPGDHGRHRGPAPARGPYTARTHRSRVGSGQPVRNCTRRQRRPRASVAPARPTPTIGIAHQRRAVRRCVRRWTVGSAAELGLPDDVQCAAGTEPPDLLR